MNATFTLPDQYQTFFSSRLTPEQMLELEKFLEPFSTTGGIYVCNTVTAAIKKPWKSIMSALRAEWNDTWSHNPLDRIGDPDDVTTLPNDPTAIHGLRNACAHFNVYKRLGIPTPKGLY